MSIRILARAAIYGLAGVAALDAIGLAIVGLIVWDADFFRSMTTFSPMLARVLAFQWVMMTIAAWQVVKMRVGR